MFNQHSGYIDLGNETLLPGIPPLLVGRVVWRPITGICPLTPNKVDASTVALRGKLTLSLYGCGMDAGMALAAKDALPVMFGPHHDPQ